MPIGIDKQIVNRKGQSMKKLIAVILMVVGLGGAGLAFYLYQTKAAQLTVEKILPEGAVGYVRLSDVEQRWDHFKTTRLWQNLIAIDVPQLMERGHFPPEKIAQYNKLKEWLSDPRLSSLFMKFFGQEIALGFYSLDSGDPGLSQPTQLPNVPQMASGLIVVTRLKQEAEIFELLSHLLKTLASNLETRTQSYKRHNIITVGTAGQPFLAYTKVKKFLVFSATEKGVQRSIDALSKARRPLLEDKFFLAVRSQFLDSAKTVWYANIEFILSGVWKNIMAWAPRGSEDQEKIDQQMDQALGQMKGLKAWVYSSAADGQLLRQRFSILYDKQQIDPHLKTVYSCLPAENKTIHFVPASAIGYQWNNCYDLKTQWEYFKQHLTQQDTPEKEAAKSLAEAIASIESSLKLSIEKDILPAFSDELGGYLRGVDLAGAFPIPQLSFFIKISDQAAADKVMNALTQNPYLMRQNENYKNIPMKYFAIPLGAELEPGYCFLNGYLLLASSRKELKGAIDAAGDPSLSLAADGWFKKVNQGLTDKNNSVFFLNLNEIVHQGRGIIEWSVNQMKAKAGRQRAFKEGMEKRGGELKSDLSEQESQMKKLQSDLKTAQDELAVLKAQGQDQAASLAKIDQLEKQIETQQENIKSLRDNQTQLEETLAGFKEEKADPELIGLYVDKVVFPILEGLQSYKAMGSRMVFGEEALESTTFIKVEE